MTIDEHVITVNDTLCSVNFSHTCDGIRECLVTFNATNFVRIDKLLLYIKLFYPDDENDREFKRRIMETVVDAEKLLKGINANPLLNVIMRDFFDRTKVDFAFKLPFEPVRN